MQTSTKFLPWLLPLFLVACQPIQPPNTQTTSQLTRPQSCQPTAGQPLTSAIEAEQELPSVLQLADENEPGEPLVVTGNVYTADCATPLAHAFITIWQTDAAGVYDDLEGMLRTDTNGRYEIHTVKPGYYAGESNPPPMHIHFIVAHPDARSIESEFVFADDPIYQAMSRDMSTLVVTLEQTSEASGRQWRGTFDIVLAAK